MSESSNRASTLQENVQIQWGVMIPLRDGIHLNATVYLPREHATPTPAIVTLTPYIGQTYHDQGVYFAASGYPFLTVDVRGRGNSEGEFRPFIQEAEDGFDVVEWLAQQPYCNGQVAMWGGSYAGTNQWVTAARRPPHLATIAPVASVYLGSDFPMRRNIFWPYIMQWLTFVSGRTLQDKLFEDHCFWSQAFRRWFESGAAFNELDVILGNPSQVFQEWISHPKRDEYWDRYNPSVEQLARLSLPTLTITGIYDNAQRGALKHYRQCLQSVPAHNRSQHFLVIGPWDHAGTRMPKREFGGIEFGPESLLDLQKLHSEWYGWTMQGGPKPEFLQSNVAYYVTGVERWRYAHTLEDVTAECLPLYLDSNGAACGIFSSGVLAEEPGRGAADVYVHDPRDTRCAKIEVESSAPLCLRPNFPTDDLTDQRELYARESQRLVYHSAAFERDSEISGFFKLSAWISIDTPDTDFAAFIYELDTRGRSLFLTWDAVRARYRESLREERLVQTCDARCYEFTDFSFVSRLIPRGSRLRLVIGPLHSPYFEKNYNGGGVVSQETITDARPVTVKLFHDRSRPSVLHVPLGAPRAREPLGLRAAVELRAG